MKSEGGGGGGGGEKFLNRITCIIFISYFQSFQLKLHPFIPMELVWLDETSVDPDDAGL